MNTIAAADNRSKYSTGSSRIFPSKTEGIALCTAYSVICVYVLGNLLTIVLFAVNRRLLKRSLFVFIIMLGTVTLPIYIYDLFGVYFKFWKGGSLMSLDIFYMIADSVFRFASLNSARNTLHRLLAHSSTEHYQCQHRNCYFHSLYTGSSYHRCLDCIDTLNINQTCLVCVDVKYFDSNFHHM